MAAKCRQIQEFKARNIQSITDVGACALIKSYGTQLRVLDLSSCSGIGGETLEHIITCCGGANSNLIKLYLTWIIPCEDCHVTAILYACHKLKKLKVEGCKALSIRGFECLAYPVDSRNEKNHSNNNNNNNDNDNDSNELNESDDNDNNHDNDNGNDPSSPSFPLDSTKDLTSSSFPKYRPLCRLSFLDLSWCNKFTSEMLKVIVKKNPGMMVLDYYKEPVCLQL